jgi:hypothetical protein
MTRTNDIWRPSDCSIGRLQDFLKEIRALRNSVVVGDTMTKIVLRSC